MVTLHETSSLWLLSLASPTSSPSTNTCEPFSRYWFTDSASLRQAVTLSQAVNSQLSPSSDSFQPVGQPATRCLDKAWWVAGYLEWFSTLYLCSGMETCKKSLDRSRAVVYRAGFAFSWR